MRTNTLKSYLTLALITGLVGCANDDINSDLGHRSLALTDGTVEAAGVLALLNHSETTERFLDDVVRLDSRAAKSIVNHRNGADGQHGTLDDSPFQSIEEADGLYWVGPKTLERLETYATVKGFLPGPFDMLGAWEGIELLVWEVEAIVDAANLLDNETLDTTVGLDARAARSLVANRPFDSINGVVEAYYVGPSNLGKLLRFVRDSPIYAFEM